MPVVLGDQKSLLPLWSPLQSCPQESDVFSPQGPGGHREHCPVIHLCEKEEMGQSNRNPLGLGLSAGDPGINPPGDEGGGLSTKALAMEA